MFSLRSRFLCGRRHLDGRHGADRRRLHVGRSGRRRPHGLPLRTAEGSPTRIPERLETNQKTSQSLPPSNVSTPTPPPSPVLPLFRPQVLLAFFCLLVRSTVIGRGESLRQRESPYPS